MLGWVSKYHLYVIFSTSTKFEEDWVQIGVGRVQGGSWEGHIMQNGNQSTEFYDWGRILLAYMSSFGNKRDASNPWRIAQDTRQTVPTKGCDTHPTYQNRYRFPPAHLSRLKRPQNTVQTQFIPRESDEIWGRYRVGNAPCMLPQPVPA